MIKRKIAVVLLGISGILFYLVASGCATFDYGNIKTEVNGEKIVSNKKIKSIFIALRGDPNDYGFLEALKLNLKRDGYDVADDSAAADLQVDLDYKTFPNKFKQMNIVFGIPMPSSYDGRSAEATATFTILDQQVQKFYRAQYVYVVSEKIAADIKAFDKAK